MPSEEAVEAAEKSGLFVEPDFVSPCIPKEE
jgi:hypothetical protein